MCLLRGRHCDKERRARPPAKASESLRQNCYCLSVCLSVAKPWLANNKVAGGEAGVTHVLGLVGLPAAPQQTRKSNNVKRKSLRSDPTSTGRRNCDLLVHPLPPPPPPPVPHPPPPLSLPHSLSLSLSFNLCPSRYLSLSLSLSLPLCVCVSLSLSLSLSSSLPRSLSLSLSFSFFLSLLTVATRALYNRGRSQRHNEFNDPVQEFMGPLKVTSWLQL